jgi:hypothetical protein
MMTWEVQFCKPSCITSHGCEVFRRVSEVLHMWHCLMTGLKISSQAIEYLVLGNCKKCESREERGQVLDRAIGVIQGQNIFQYLSSFAVGEV